MFVVFRNPNDYLKAIFDGYENPNVLIEKEFKSGWLSFIERLHNSIKLNRIYNLPFKRIWYSHYLNYKKLNKMDKIYFIFFEGSRVGYQKEYLFYLKNKYPNSKYIFRFINPINQNNSWMVEYAERYYDLIISMDQSNCEKYNWEYVNNTYNTRFLETERREDIDVFFVGSNKGRLNKIIKIYKFLTDKGVKCEFFITDVRKKDRIKGLLGIHYIKKMKYRKTVELINRAKCLLEIVQEGQTGSTLRSMEALVYRKKLLTDDKNIRRQEYFDAENMFVFKGPNEIDKNFIFSKVVENEALLNKISHDILFKRIESYFKRL